MNQRLQSGYISIKRKRFWVIRYVEVYSDNKLYYYYNQGDTDHRGVFDLEQATITQRKSKDSQIDNIIQIHTGREVIQLMSESQNEHKKWVSTIMKISKSDQDTADMRYSNLPRISQQKKKYSIDVGQYLSEDDDYNQNDLQFQMNKPFIFDKEVIQERFNGNDQLMLKANTSFFISEFKDMILTNVSSEMKVFMCKTGKQKEQVKSQNTKSPKKEVRDYIINHVNNIKNNLGIPIFCLGFIAIFIMCFVIFYMLFEIFNTSSIIFSFLACLNIFTLPYVFLQAKKKKKQIENQVFRLKVSTRFPHNLNQLLFIMQKLNDRQKWHPHILRQNVQKETINLQYTDFENTQQEVFQVTIYQESKFIYIVEHTKGHIIRVYQLNYSDALNESFELNYYCKVSGPKFSQITSLTNENIIKSLSLYIMDQKTDIDSELYTYIKQQQIKEIETFQEQRGTILAQNNKSSLQQDTLQLQKKQSNKDKEQSAIKQLKLDEVEPQSLQSSQINQNQQQQQLQNKTIDLCQQLEQPGEQQQQQQQQQISNQTPEEQKYNAIIKGVRDRIEQFSPLIDQNGWVEEKKAGTHMLHTREFEQVPQVRIEEIFNVPIQFFVDYVSEVTRRGEYDELFKCGEYVKVIHDNLKVVRNELKGMLMVSGRDFILINSTVYENNNNKAFLCAQSITEFDESNPSPKGIVRGFMRTAGWMVETIGENQVKGVFIAHTDLKGSIGKKLYSVGFTKQYKGIKKLKDILEKSYAKNK